MRRLIPDYTREAGVRQLEREIAALTRKVTRKLVSNGKLRRPLILSAKKIPDLLGPARFHSETAEKIKEIGIATGLVWTPVGGEVVFIEATRMPGKGNLLLTGSAGRCDEGERADRIELPAQSGGVARSGRHGSRQVRHPHPCAGRAPCPRTARAPA